MLLEPSSWKLVFLGKGLPPAGGCYRRRVSLLVQESAFPLTWLPCSRGWREGLSCTQGGSSPFWKAPWHDPVFTRPPLMDSYKIKASAIRCGISTRHEQVY